MRQREQYHWEAFAEISVLQQGLTQSLLPNLKYPCDVSHSCYQHRKFPSPLSA